MNLTCPHTVYMLVVQPCFVVLTWTWYDEDGGMPVDPPPVPADKEKKDVVCYLGTVRGCTTAATVTVVIYRRVFH